MKKLLKFFVLPIMLLSCALMVSGCLDKPEDKIAIHTPFKTVYYVGEELDVTGGILNYTKDGKTTQVAITSTMVTGFNTFNAGNYNMIITYEGLTVVVPYTINSIPALSVNFNTVYRSEFGADYGPGGGYYYAKFINGTTLGLFGSSQLLTDPDFDTTYSQYNISSKQFVNGKWVISVISDDLTANITIISENQLKLHAENGVASLDIDLFAI